MCERCMRCVKCVRGVRGVTVYNIPQKQMARFAVFCIHHREYQSTQPLADRTCVRVCECGVCEGACGRDNAHSYINLVRKKSTIKLGHSNG